MFTIISRIFHFGFKNFWRNGWLSTATVAIMTLALLVFAGSSSSASITSRAAASIQDKIDISVYFNTNTSEDEILNIQQSLEGLSQVASVDYVSRDQALATFKQNHANDPTISAGDQRARYESARSIAEYQGEGPEPVRRDRTII